MVASPLRIVIADDDRSVREILQQLLRTLGHDVVATAENGETLVKQCDITQPDVVITDNLMPGMSGADAAAIIYKRRRLPIILLSGYSDRDLVLSAEEKHVMMYLVKPISQDHLEAALARCCSDAFQGRLREPGAESGEPNRRDLIADVTSIGARSGLPNRPLPRVMR